MLFSFFAWWYGPGLLAAVNDIPKRTLGVVHSFSVTILLKTLFAPWRRITTIPGAGLDAKFHALIDNAMSRLVGFTVRIIVLLTALFMACFTAVFFTAVALAWPLMPAAVVYCLVRTITG